MRAPFVMDHSEALYECLAIEAMTADASPIVALAERGIVGRLELLRAGAELRVAHRRARQLGQRIGRSSLRPWLARTLRGQRALLRRLDDALGRRTARLTTG